MGGYRWNPRLSRDMNSRLLFVFTIQITNQVSQRQRYYNIYPVFEQSGGQVDDNEVLLVNR